MLRFLRTLNTLRMPTAPQNPLVTIVGATGTGKSDLAVEIARKYNGEIINGDAMQLYKGLPIITNKITEEEKKGIPHHLLGCIGLEQETWTVGKFVSSALEVIQDIHSRGKLPILVGGTHYYTQSLLFHDALSAEPTLDLDDDTNQNAFPILSEPTPTILAKLEQVDPTMANRWHPNERRKIQRSLEIYLRTGKPASQLYEEQRSARSQQDSPGLRFPTLTLWLHADKSSLHPRLDARVDKMLTRGLLSEVSSLHSFQRIHEARTGVPIDQTRGIWVSIGYKEFLPYQARLASEAAGPDDTTTLAAEKAAAVSKTQAATRQYANRQTRWIRIKLLGALRGAASNSAAGGAMSTPMPAYTYMLDGTELTAWGERVIVPAGDVVGAFLAGGQGGEGGMPDPVAVAGPHSAAAGMLSAIAGSPDDSDNSVKKHGVWLKRTCETCGVVALTENDWKLHGASRAHRRAVGVRKRAANKAAAAKEKEKYEEEQRKGKQREVVDVLEGYLDLDGAAGLER